MTIASPTIDSKPDKKALLRRSLNEALSEDIKGLRVKLDFDDRQVRTR